MNKIILNDRNKLKISVIMLSTIVISCFFMIFNENKEYEEVEDISLGDTYETKNLEYTVVFNDSGYEYNRPSVMKFGLYEENTTSPKQIITLEKNKCRRGSCTITFENVREKDDNDNTINYIVKEIGDYGYNVTYEGTRIVNDANMKDVNIDVFDTNNNRVLNSILAIIDSNGNEILTTTTGVKTSTIKLLRGQYKLIEKDSPKGFKRFKEIDFKLLDDGTLEINGAIKDKFTITKEKISITINLVNEFNEVIPEIKIELEDITNGNIAKTTFSNTKDIEVNSELDVDSEYKLTQLKEAFEYLNAKDIVFTFNKDNQIVIDGEVQESSRVVLVVHPAFYHITVEKKTDGEIAQDEEFKFNIVLEGYSGIITSSKGDLSFSNGSSSFTLIPNEEISIKVPTYTKYHINEDTEYEKKIEGKNIGEVQDDVKIVFTNIKVEEEIVVPAPITGINKIAYLLTSLLLVLLGFLGTLYYKKKKTIKES